MNFDTLGTSAFCPLTPGFLNRAEILDKFLAHLCNRLSSTTDGKALGTAEEKNALNQVFDALIIGWENECYDFTEELEQFIQHEPIKSDVRGQVYYQVPGLIDGLNQELWQYRYKFVYDDTHVPFLYELANGRGNPCLKAADSSFLDETPNVLQLYIIAISIQTAGVALCQLSRGMRRLRMITVFPCVIDEHASRSAEQHEATVHSTGPPKTAADAVPDFEAIWDAQDLYCILPAMVDSLTNTLQEKTAAIAAALGRDLRSDMRSPQASAEANALRYGMSVSNVLKSAKTMVGNFGRRPGWGEENTQKSVPVEDMEAICRDFGFWQSCYLFGHVTDSVLLEHLRGVERRAATAILIMRPVQMTSLQAADPRLPHGYFFGNKFVTQHEGTGPPNATTPDSNPMHMGRMNTVFQASENMVRTLEARRKENLLRGDGASCRTAKGPNQWCKNLRARLSRKFL